MKHTLIFAAMLGGLVSGQGPLQPEKVTPLEFPQSTQVRDFAVAGRSAYFLMCHQERTAKLQILDLSTYGVRSTLDVDPHSLRIAEVSPALVIIARDPTGSRLQIFESSGIRVTKHFPATHIVDCGRVRPGLACATFDEILTLAENDAYDELPWGRARFSFTDLALTQFSSHGELFAVSVMDGRMLRVDAQTRIQTGVRTLLAPELQQAVRPKGAAMIRSAAVSDNGELYVLATGAKLHEGVPVLRFDQNANWLQNVRLAMPTTNLGHPMYPSYLRISSGHLYVVDRSAKLMATYRLPR